MATREAIRVIIGANVRRLRERAGLSQRELAERVGMEPTYISHVECWRRCPSVDAMYMLASALETHPAVFMVADAREAEALGIELVNVFGDD